MRRDGQDVPVLAARASSGDARADGYKRRARSMREVGNILAAASGKEFGEETC